MKTIYTFLFLFVSAGYLQAQSPSMSTDVIRWNIDHFEDVNAHVTENVSSWFITDHQTAIQWVQGNGSYTMDFTVNSVSGSWSDLATEGSLLFNVTLDGKSGTLWIGRTSTAVEIRFTFMEGGQNKMPFVFHVSSYEEN